MDNDFRVWPDATRNRLYLVIKGFLTDSELALAAEHTIREIARLAAHYTVIADISKMTPATPTGVQHIWRTQTHLAGTGVRRVILVADPDNPAPLRQFERGFDKLCAVETACSLAEAEKMLEK